MNVCGLAPVGFKCLGWLGVYPPIFSMVKTPVERGRVVASDLDRRAGHSHGLLRHVCTAVTLFSTGWISCLIWLVKWGDY